MGEQHADQGHRKFWATMKEMSWKERVTHILYYYGKYFFIAAFLVYVFADVLIYTNKEKPEQILAGTAINVHVSVDMEKILTEDAFFHVGGENTDKQEVTLNPNRLMPSDFILLSQMRTELLTGKYDYVLMDQTALEILLSMQALPNLYQLLPEEKWEPWNDRFISVQTDGKTFPVAIDITGTPLAAECTYDGNRIYLGFPVNIDTLDIVEPLLEYLVSQGLLETP